MYHLKKQRGMWCIYKNGRPHSIWQSFAQASEYARRHWLFDEQFKVLRQHGLIWR